MKKAVLLFGLMIGLITTLHAQQVTGSWFGVGKVDLPGSSNTYMSELVLTQKGKQVTGLFNYYFRDSLFSNKITGSFDAVTRKLTINKTQLIHHSSANTITGIDCPMSGEFILRISKVESVLTGSLFSTKDFRFTCPPINYKLKLNNDTSTVETTPEPEPVKDTVVAPEKVVEVSPEEKEKTAIHLKRGKEYIKEIVVSNPVIKLEFYDNGAIDYDSISVFFNNKMVLPKTMLSHRAIRFSVTLNTALPFNELAMFAESLGMIPPNTAAVVLYDGTKRYDVLLTSDLNKTATIKLIYKKE
jgi:hypothetical protein